MIEIKIENGEICVTRDSSAPQRTNKGKSLIEALDNYVVVDLETTGLDPQWDSIIEVAAIRVENGIEICRYQSLVNPSFDIDSFITELTGITNEMLSDAPSLLDVLRDFVDFIDNNVIVAHNANFDVNFLYDKCSEFLDIEFSNDFVDTMRVSRRLYKDYPHHRLCDLVERFEIEGDMEHRALSDALKTYKCYEHMKSYAVNHGIVFSSLYPSPSGLRAKDIHASTTEFGEGSPVHGKEFVFTGVLEKMLRRDAVQVVVNMGGMCGDSVTKRTNYLVLGNNDYCKTIKGGKSSKQKKAEKLKLSGLDIEIISENVFYGMLPGILASDVAPSSSNCAKRSSHADNIPVPSLDKFELELLRHVRDMLISSDAPVEHVRFSKSDCLYIKCYYRTITIGKVRGRRFIGVSAEHLPYVSLNLEHDIIKMFYRFFLSSPCDILLYSEYIKYIVKESFEGYEFHKSASLQSSALSKHFEEYVRNHFDFINDLALAGDISKAAGE